jgi:hypothetical protein
MSGFISHIIARHTNPGFTIHPRLPGKFEPGFIRENIYPEASYDTGSAFEQSDKKPAVSIAGDPGNERSHFSKITVSQNWPSGQETIVGKDNDPPPEKVNSGRSDISNARNIDPTDPFEPVKTTSFQKRAFLNMVFPDKPGDLSETDPVEEKNHEEMPSFMENDPKPNTMHAYLSSNGDTMPQAGKSEKGYLNSKELLIYQGSNGMKKNSNSSLSGFLNMNRQQKISSVIKVSIGRIDVRTITDPKPVKVNASDLHNPKMTLDDYLKKRNKAE